MVQIEPLNGYRSILTANDANHARQRNLITHAFSERALKQPELFLQFYIHLLVGKLHAKIEAGDPVVDLAEWYNFALFDIIGELAYGQAFHNLENLENHADHPWTMGGIRLAVRLMQIGAFILLEYILWLLPRSFMVQRLAILEFIQNRVSERLALETDKPNMTFSIIRRHSNDAGKRLISREWNGFYLFGLDCSRQQHFGHYAFKRLLLPDKEPKELRRLSEELRGAFPTEDKITILSTPKLLYLLAVLEESMRLHPSVPISLPSVILPGGATISGNWVPGGVSYLATRATRGSLRKLTSSPPADDFRNPKLAAYLSSLHFADPTSFIPERHLATHDPKFDNDSKTILQPFSFGPRNCIGKS